MEVASVRPLAVQTNGAEACLIAAGREGGRARAPPGSQRVKIPVFAIVAI